VAICPLAQFRPQLPHSARQEIRRLLCQPLLMFRICIQHLQFGPEFFEKLRINRTRTGSPSGCFRADPLQLHQPLMEALPQAATLKRSCAMASKVRPSPSSAACLPVYCCQRRTITSQYFGSTSTP